MKLARIGIVILVLLISDCASQPPHRGWVHPDQCDMRGDTAIKKNFAEICHFDGSYFREQSI